MKKLYCSVILAIGAMIVPAAAVHGASADDMPINAMCPIGKEPIVPSAGTIEYKGRTIGLCCPGCGKAFLAWDEARRDAFVALAMRGAEPGRGHESSSPPPASSPSTAASSPDPLDVCIVSGEKLGSMGEPVSLNHEGREVRLCCRACVKKFEESPDRFLEQLDRKIVETQLMHYPLETCIVAGSRLGSMGEPVNLVHGNRLLRFCCAACVPTFRADPAKYLAALDRQIVERQSKSYPLKVCVVAGGELGSMGTPVDHVFANRLVRFCCASCVGTFEADPLAYMAKIDQAYADAQRASYPLDTCVVAGGALGSMGDPVELVAGTRLVRFCCDGCFPAFRKEPQKYLAKLRRE